MKLFDGLLDMMHLDTTDDYDFNNDDYLDEDAIESKRKQISKVKKEETFDEPEREKPVKMTPKITPISKGTKKQVLGMEVCVVKPTTVEDSREIAETLLNGRTVVLNVEGLNVDIAQRIIDFTSGACFAIRGNLQKISNYIFIVTPENVDVSGDILGMVDAFSNSDFGI